MPPRWQLLEADLSRDVPDASLAKEQEPGRAGRERSPQRLTGCRAELATALPVLTFPFDLGWGSPFCFISSSVLPRPYPSILRFGINAATAFATWECVSLLGYGESFVLAPSDILSWTGPPLLPERGDR